MRIYTRAAPYRCSSKTNRRVEVTWDRGRSVTGYIREICWSADEPAGLQDFLRRVNFRMWEVTAVGGDPVAIEEFTVAVIAARLSQ